MYLDGGDEGEILLPTRYVPEGCKPGDELEVFIYLDQDERPIATTLKPLAKVGDFAYLDPLITQSYYYVNQYAKNTHILWVKSTFSLSKLPKPATTSPNRCPGKHLPSQFPQPPPQTDVRTSHSSPNSRQQRNSKLRNFHYFDILSLVCADTILAAIILTKIKHKNKRKET